MNYNVSVNIFLKDHRIMSYCTTENVDEQSDYYRAVFAKTWRGPNYKVLKQTVLFGSHDIIFNIHFAKLIIL